MEDEIKEIIKYIEELILSLSEEEIEKFSNFLEENFEIRRKNAS